jgi:hypothetical protein
VTRSSQDQCLRALAASDIENPIAAANHLAQLRSDELLTNDVTQLTEPRNPALLGACEAHILMPIRSGRHNATLELPGHADGRG